MSVHIEFTTFMHDACLTVLIPGSDKAVGHKFENLTIIIHNVRLNMHIISLV